MVDLSWIVSEVDTGSHAPVANPNGVVEPGESARFDLNISFTPGVGTTTTYTPPPAPGVGTIAGFAAGAVDLFITPAQAGTWTPTQLLPGWGLGGPWIIGPGGALGMTVGQPIPQPGVTVNPANPILSIRWTFWTPASYEPRTFSYLSDFQHESVLLYVQYGLDPMGNPLYIAKQVDGGLAMGMVQIAPAPGTSALAAVAAIAAPRRRRTSEGSDSTSAPDRCDHKPV